MQINPTHKLSPDEHALAGQAENQRSEPRRPFTGLVGLVQRTRIIFHTDGKARSCRIQDASDHGFRITLTPAANVEIGTELTLEHEDGWRRKTRVCWVAGNELGLEIIGANTFVILDDGAEMLPCEILSISENMYRITLAPARKILGEFSLEFPNRTRVRVRMRWSHEDELGLQIIETCTKPKR